MQGSGVSSDSIWTPFDSMTTAITRSLCWILKIAWKRIVNETSGFAVIGTSLIDGVDIVRPTDGIITQTDQFSYDDETENVLRLEYDRKIVEPLGGMALAQADILLDNTNLRYTPDYSQTIGTAILPNRPLQMFIGFLVRSQNKGLAIFKGLTETPREDKVSRSVSIHCFDYIRYMNQYPLESTIYTDQRSDQIIEDILTTVGFGTSQYSLDTGLNTIGFAWFQKGETAGERIRKICEAEEAFFYQDEQGILRFENRRHYSVSPHNTIQWTFEPEDIMEWRNDESVEVINRCTVRARPRAAKTTTMDIWDNGYTEEIDYMETKTIWASFENPVIAIDDPISGTDFIANQAADGSGADCTGNVSIVITKFTQSAKLEITNVGLKCYMTTLKLQGLPTVVTAEIEEVFQDNDSIAKYDEKQLEIENDFIDSISFAYYLARAIVAKYKTPMKRIEITVPGVPQLQLMDKVRVKDKDLGTYTNYRVMVIKGILAPGSFIQKLTLREITDYEADSWAIVGISTIDSETEFIGV